MDKTASHILDTVSPLATVARGYSITFKDNDMVKIKHQLKTSDTLVSKFADGEVTSQVLAE